MNILESFADVKVLVVGDIMLDRYWWGSVKRISPEAPVPVVDLQRSTFAPGGAANVAANITGLGADALLVVTEWEEFRTLDWERVHRSMARPLVLDGRNLLDPELMAQRGFEYHSFGRPE